MEELSLKWDEHHPAVISVFEELLEKGTLVDCTIAADGQYVKAHKVVLAACSPYFELLFSQEHEKNPIVVLKDIKFQELKYLIDFVYRGQVKLQQDQLDAFVAAAESLQIKGLSGQQRKKIPERSANKAVLSKEGRVSPVPCKRRRSSRSRQNEDSQSVPSSGNDSSSDSNVHESLSSTIVTSVPSTSAVSTVGSIPRTLSTQQDRCEAQASFSSQDQPSSSPEEVLPDVTAIIKTEPEDPEPLAEVFFPEPKSEEYVDDMALLESGDGPTETQGDTSQQSTSDYPGFPSYNCSGSTFLMNQMADPSATPVADLSPTDGGLSCGGTGPEERDAAVGAQPTLPPPTEKAARPRGGPIPAQSTLFASGNTTSSRVCRSRDSTARRDQASTRSASATRHRTLPGAVRYPRHERPTMGMKKRFPGSAASATHVVPHTSNRNSSASRMPSCARGGFSSNVNSASRTDFSDVKPVKDVKREPSGVSLTSSMTSTSASSGPERKHVFQMSSSCKPPIAVSSDTKADVFRNVSAGAGVSSRRPSQGALGVAPTAETKPSLATASRPRGDRDRGLRFLCPICMVVFRKCIRKRKHERDILFKCLECGYGLRSSDRL